MQTVECLRIRQRDSFAEVTYKPATTAVTHTENNVIIKPETNLPNSARRCGNRQATTGKPRYDATG